MPNNEEEILKDEDITCEAEEKDVTADDVVDTEAEAVESEVEDGEADAEKEGKAKRFSKKDKKEKKDKKDKKDQKIDELNDRLIRLMAEYDNYMKRTDREKSMMYEMGVKSIVEKILPVVDNFERGFSCMTPEDEENPFVQGMQKIYEQFINTLSEAGITAIEAVGKEFDPNLHNAVMHIDDDAFGINEVAEEFQKGYMYRDTVIRYSMVKVAN